MPNELTQFIAVFLLMLVTGIFWGPWFALHRSMKVFTEEEFIHIVKTMSKNLGIPMRVLMPLCILFLSLSVWKYPFKTELGFYLTIAALFFILTSLIITIAIEVPIVKKIELWTVATVPGNWRNIQNRWLKFHVIRTFSSIISFICSVAAILLLVVYTTASAEKLVYTNTVDMLASNAPEKDSIDKSKFYITQDTLLIPIGDRDTAVYSKATFNEIVDKYPSLYNGEVTNPDISYYSKPNKEDFESEAGQDEYYILYTYFLKQKNGGEKYDSCRKKADRCI